MMVGKVRERLSVSKQAAKNFDVENYHLEKSKRCKSLRTVSAYSLNNVAASPVLVIYIWNKETASRSGRLDR
jgi:hypothetical protein